MDPALVEEILVGDDRDEVPVLVRLRAPDLLPPDLHVVSRFSDIITARVARGRIAALRAAPGVVSVKPTRAFTNAADPPGATQPPARPGPRGVPDATGAGVVVAVLDWGCDVAHPAFRDDRGDTRLLALWNQGAAYDPARAHRFGYGRIFRRAEIDAALRAADPYTTLEYHPALADPHGLGSHGTHVMDIAAGAPYPGSPGGLAPAADLVFVHLHDDRAPRLATLGDSARILEAIDFADEVAGDRPLCINLSLGRRGGPHDGSTLVERALDNFVTMKPGRAIIQSCGNYARTAAHAQGTLRTGGSHTLRWVTHPGDRTTNELEVWYPGCDALDAALVAPDDGVTHRVERGGVVAIRRDDRLVARAYHRLGDPNNSDNLIDIFVYDGAPAGIWRVHLTGEHVVDGRFHAWIERDDPRPDHRSELLDADPRGTLGTIATGRYTISVGALDPARGGHASFSSRGPTRDGRQRPDLLAPGVAIAAARSCPLGGTPGAPARVVRSGTSMAAPHVTGTVALLYQRLGGLPIEALRARLLCGCRVDDSGEPVLDVTGALASIADATPSSPEYMENAMQTEPTTQIKALLAAPDGERYVDFLFDFGVKRFQAEQRLEIDGLVGPRTLAAIDTVLGPSTAVAADPALPYPRGKGMFIRALAHTGTPAQACDRAREAGLRWVAVQRCWQYADKPTQKLNGAALARYASAFTAAGIDVWLWGYPVPGKHAEFNELLLSSARSIRARGVIVDAEKPFSTTSARAAATTLMSTLLAAAHADGLSVGFTSYGAPNMHPRFPWESFTGADFAVPQIYEATGDKPFPADYPRRSVQRWRALGFRTIVPASAAYRHTTAGMRDLLRRTPVPNGALVWWDWYNCSRVPIRWKVVRETTLAAPTDDAELSSEREKPPFPTDPDKALDLAGLTVVDLRASAKRSYRKYVRAPSAIKSVVLHQMGCAGWKDSSASWGRVKAHYIVRRDGVIVCNHDPVWCLTTGSNYANEHCITLEFEGNYPSTRGKWFKPEKFGAHQLRDAPKQVEAGRLLLQRLHETYPIEYVYAHRQWRKRKGNCCGPDLWREVGKFAIEKLGLSDGGPGWHHPHGAPIPNNW